MKTLPKTALFLPLLTVALLSGCGTTAVTAPQAAVAPKSAGLTAQGKAKPPKDMQMAEASVSGRIGAWAKGRIGAWARGQDSTPAPCLTAPPTPSTRTSRPGRAST